MMITVFWIIIAGISKEPVASIFYLKLRGTGSPETSVATSRTTPYHDSK
jgi:hypothetical protein